VRHRCDVGTALGPPPHAARPCSCAAGVQSATLGRRQRMAVARLDSRDHAPLDAAAGGAAGGERASPAPGGQSALGAAAPDGARPGAPDAPAGAPRAAYGRADHHWRPHVQRPRTGPGLPPTACALAGPPAEGCGAVGTCATTPAWHHWASTRAGGALAAAETGPARGADDLAPRARARGRGATARAGTHPRDGGVGRGSATRPCPCVGSSCAAPRASLNRRRLARRARMTAPVTSCDASSRAGRARRPSRPAGPISAWRPSGSGQIRPWHAPPVCLRPVRGGDAAGPGTASRGPGARPQDRLVRHVARDVR
jgi:hypothetical protein